MALMKQEFLDGFASFNQKKKEEKKGETKGTKNAKRTIKKECKSKGENKTEREKSAATPKLSIDALPFPLYPFFYAACNADKRNRGIYWPVQSSRRVYPVKLRSNHYLPYFRFPNVLRALSGVERKYSVQSIVCGIQRDKQFTRIIGNNIELTIVSLSVFDSEFIQCAIE